MKFLLSAYHNNDPSKQRKFLKSLFGVMLPRSSQPRLHCKTTKENTKKTFKERLTKVLELNFHKIIIHTLMSVSSFI